MNKFFVAENYLNFLKKRVLASWAKIFNRVFKTKTTSSDLDGGISPVFIVGLPRSGSTIAYQLLTSYLDVEYVSNYLEKSYFFPLRAFKKQLNKKPAKVSSSFRSEYGETDKSNLWEPNQGINFWYNWMPSELHHHELADFTTTQLSDLENVINSMLKLSGKNVLFKELSLSQKIPVLKTVFPKAKFILISRNSSEVASSIYRAMEKNNIPDGVMWGAQFKGFEEYLDLPRKEMIASQVKQLENSVTQFTTDLNEDQLLEVEFADLCEKPQQFVLECSQFLDCKVKAKLDNIDSAISKRAKKCELTASFDKLLDS